MCTVVPRLSCAARATTAAHSMLFTSPPSASQLCCNEIQLVIPTATRQEQHQQPICSESCATAYVEQCACSAVTMVEPPGPGSYEPNTGNELAQKVLSKNLGPSSPFKSSTARSAMFSRTALLNKPPGPAFYKPHLPVDHRSFHFGAVKDSFVPAGAGISDLDLTKQRAPVISS